MLPSVVLFPDILCPSARLSLTCAWLLPCGSNGSLVPPEVQAPLPS